MKSKHARKRIGLPVLPAVVIASGVGSAHALELGSINVHSSLGQPLRASIAYALAPHEAIDGYCVSLAPASRDGGMPSVSQADITVSNGLITISGKAAIADPLLTASLKVNCPYTPTITREYMLFVDPSAARESETLQAATPVPRATRTEPAPRPAVEPPGKIAAGVSYRVQPGDSLSRIVRRLQDSNAAPWSAVNDIFVSNPHAFINADPNQLKAGVLLRIPRHLAGSDVAVRPGRISEPAATETAAPAARSARIAGDAGSVAPLAPVAGEAIPADSEEAVRRPDGMAAVNDLLDSDGYSATDALLTSVAKAENVEPVNTTPREPAVVAEPVYAADYADGSNAVWWTLGAALAAIAGLLVRRRRARADRDDLIAAAVARVERPPRHLDEPSIEVEIIGMPETGESLDYDLSDDSPTDENPVLDANLVSEQEIGRYGANERADASADLVLDLDLGEAALAEPEECETGIIPPPDRSAGSILESEVLPEEHEYELSVVVDVTKMPMPEDATERDLKAVVIDTADDSMLIEEIDGYTLSQEVDYQILEQDYEDELTATQALNIEIERAARELARELDGELTIDTEVLSREEMMAIPFTDVARLDLASALCADNDDVSAGEDATDTAEITARLGAGAG